MEVKSKIDTAKAGNSQSQAAIPEQRTGAPLTGMQRLMLRGVHGGLQLRQSALQIQLGGVFRVPHESRNSTRTGKPCSASASEAQSRN